MKSLQKVHVCWRKLHVLLSKKEGNYPATLEVPLWPPETRRKEDKRILGRKWNPLFNSLTKQAMVWTSTPIPLSLRPTSGWCATDWLTDYLPKIQILLWILTTPQGSFEIYALERPILFFSKSMWSVLFCVSSCLPTCLPQFLWPVAILCDTWG